MAHFAKLENNIVTEVIAVHNNEVPDEATGVAFCKSLFGEDTEWVQTSYNRNFRKNYACINDIYDPIADHFFAPQPYPSWTLDADAKWQPPVPYPTNGTLCKWDESIINWVPVTK